MGQRSKSIPCLGYPPPLSFHDSSPFVRFAHVFSERGKYVFVDSAVPDWSTVVAVSEEGTECDPRSSVFQPMTPEQLVRHGIVKQHRLNLLPDWGVIVGVSHHRPTDIFYFHLLGINGCKWNNCRPPESAAGCSGGRHHHSVGSASRQSQTCLPLAGKAKVA